MAHRHDHQGRSIRPLAIALGATAAFLIVETIAAFLTGSLALLSDAGHMLTDVMALTMALVAGTLARRSRATPKRTFGLHRLEILAALLNGLLLLGLGSYIVVSTLLRLDEPVHIDALHVILVAGAGLLANTVSLWALRPAAGDGLNIRAAHLEVLTDLLSSVGVLGGAIIILLTDWYWIDSVVGLAIGCFVIPRAVRLAIQAAGVLLQHAPPHLDVGGIERDLRDLNGVQEVHDLHVWTLTSGMDVLSVHLRLEPRVRNSEGVLAQAQALLEDEWRITHATVQTESATDDKCRELAW